MVKKRIDMGKNLVLWVLLALLALTLGILLLLPESGTIFGLESDHFGHLSYLAIVALLIASSFRLRGLRFSTFVRDIGIWLLVGLLLVGGYAFKNDISALWQRIVATLVPGHPASLNTNLVQITRNQAGEFRIKAWVNSQPVEVLFDTGASAVVLTYEDAIRAGFQPERLIFATTVETANGKTTAAPVIIETIRIGAINHQNIRALIAQKSDLKTSLLGMTFMQKLTSFSVEGNILELRN